MTSVVVFDPFAFKARFPQLCGVKDYLLQNYFDEAGLTLSNKASSRVSDLTERRILLWLLTAHIAALNGGLSAAGGVTPVGALSSATEGSVTVSFNYNALPGSQAWYQQTQWGLEYWQATLKYRTAHYIPQPTGWVNPSPYIGR